MGKQRKMDHEDGPYGGQFGGGGPEIPGSFDQPDPFEDGPPAPKQAYWQKYEGTDALGQPHYKYIDNSGIVHDVWYSYHQGVDGEGWRIYDEWMSPPPPNGTGELTTYFGDPPYDEFNKGTLHGPYDTVDTIDPNDPNPSRRLTETYDGFEDENLGQDHLPPPGIQGEDENLAKDHLPPPGIQGEDENLAKGRLPLPDPVEEPAPAPGIRGVEHFAKGPLPGLVEEEPPVGQQPPAEPPVQPNPPAEPPVEQSPTPNPPTVPGGEGGIPGMGIPYQDFIPFYPMDQDPATGEWRNAQPEEIPKPDQQPEANAPTQLDPNLLDPIAPGPTLDYGLVERIEQSPGMVDKVNQDPSVAEALERDPTQINQIEQDLGLAEQRPMEPSGGSHPNFTDPSLTEQPPPDQSTPDDGADDLTL